MGAKAVLVAMALILALTSCGNSPEASTQRRIRRVERGLLSALGDPPWKRMDLAQRMAYHHVPGVSIAVIRDYQVEWTKGYGVLQAGQGDPVTPDTLFQPASIGKVVVAVAALRYVESGALDLDRDVNLSLVSWRLPENRFTAQESVTLRRLLSHSAGVTVEGFRGYALGEEVPTLRQILDGESPANSPPIRVDAVPGAQVRYSGGGYMIVQQLLEDVTGRQLHEIMRTSVLEPWEMTDTTFESPLPERLWARAARGHRTDGATIPGGWHTYPEAGASGSLWATSADLARLAIQVMQAYGGRPDEVLSHAMALEMLTPQIDDRGLGPLVLDDGGDRFYFMHPGANEGYRSVLVAYPKRGQGAVILTNGDNGQALWHEILNSVSVEYGWVKDSTPLYVGIASAILLAFAAVVLLRRRKK